MQMEQLTQLVAGIALIAGGIKTIRDQKIAVDTDAHDEPTAWVYGWRATAIGVLFVVAGGLCLARMAGLVSLDWSSASG